MPKITHVRQEVMNHVRNVTRANFHSLLLIASSIVNSFHSDQFEPHFTSERVQQDSLSSRSLPPTDLSYQCVLFCPAHQASSGV